jgi:hypothetical protein
MGAMFVGRKAGGNQKPHSQQQDANDRQHPKASGTVWKLSLGRPVRLESSQAAMGAVLHWNGWPCCRLNFHFFDKLRRLVFKGPMPTRRKWALTRMLAKIVP